MENLSDYLVKNPKQILKYLKTLSVEKCLISANFGVSHSFLTAILDINEKEQIITIDCGPKEYLNKELLSLGFIKFKAEYAGIQVLFEGRGVKKAGELYQHALSMRVPEQIFWVQRRQFYRMRSPLSKDSYCSITFKDKIKEGNETVNFTLFDLSITGFSILSDSKEQASCLIQETEYSDCVLVFNSMDSHNISFIVRSKFASNPNKPNKIQRIGCEFTNLKPNTESACLRYMQEVEREIKKNQK